MFGRKRRRRDKIRSQPFPPEWHELLVSAMPYYRALPSTDQAEIQGHILVLMAEKNFEGCGGLALTDEIRMLVAAHAALLLLHRKSDYYPALVSILIYPSAFVVDATFSGPGHIEFEGEEIRLGEAWQRGVVILSWDSVRHGFRNPRDGYNVALHEFAHQLDMENGAADGYPALSEPALRKVWPVVFEKEFRQLTEHLDRGRPTLINEYAEQNPAEFFAVVTELFFERPAALKRRHPELYDALRRFYLQDPASVLAVKMDSEKGAP